MGQHPCHARIDPRPDTGAVFSDSNLVSSPSWSRWDLFLCNCYKVKQALWWSDFHIPAGSIYHWHNLSGKRKQSCSLPALASRA